MIPEPVELPSREAFIWRARHTEEVWERPEAFGLAWEYNPTRRTEIGPWTCECGFKCRDAGRMWDHAQTCQGAPPVQASLFDEVVLLLETAQQTTGFETRSIELRLMQALPGQMCPGLLDTPLAQKENWLGKQFWAHYRAGDLPTMAADFYALMRD